MSIIYLNNEFIEDTDKLAEHYAPWNYKGLGVFDSMLSLNGEPQYIGYHLERLRHDAKEVMNLEQAPIDDLNTAKLENIYAEILEKNNLSACHARLRTTIVSIENDDPLFLIYAAPSEELNTSALTCAIIADFPREANSSLENCKRLDYSRSFSARAKAQELGADEAILINTNGNIACGATSNIFIEEDGALITPPLSEGVLAGVTRRVLMEKREARAETITLERLKKAQKAFLTNSFFGLREIQKII